MGASPDALIQHRLPADNGQAAAAAAAAAAHGAATATAAAADAPAAAAVGPWDIDGLLARLQLAGSNSNGATGSSSGGGSGCSSNTNGTSGSSTLSNSSVCSRSTSSSGNSSGNYLIEVVEVKNSCPFGHSRRWADLVSCPHASSGVRGLLHPAALLCVHERMHAPLCNTMAWLPTLVLLQGRAAAHHGACCRGPRPPAGGAARVGATAAAAHALRR
jgi:hypothetical protein